MGLPIFCILLLGLFVAVAGGVIWGRTEGRLMALLDMSIAIGAYPDA
jgi:hypothetical protein